MRTTYSVIVGNVGTVDVGLNRQAADRLFAEYVRQSKTGAGRAGSEPVTIARDDTGDPVREYVPDPDDLLQVRAHAIRRQYAADRLRRVILRPYRPGMGPIFCLDLYDTGRTSGSHCDLAYVMTIRQAGAVRARVLFAGSDYGSSPMHAIDSNATIAGLLTFLTCRPGDTDAEYFDVYTAEQLEFCEQHAETLSGYCADRFGDR